MSQQIIDAIYEDGTFKPINGGELPLTPGQHVRIVFDEVAESAETLKLAGEVYEGLSEDEIAEIEAIAFDRSRFFDDRTTP